MEEFNLAIYTTQMFEQTSRVPVSKTLAVRSGQIPERVSDYVHCTHFAAPVVTYSALDVFQVSVGGGTRCAETLRATCPQLLSLSVGHNPNAGLELSLAA